MPDSLTYRHHQAFDIASVQSLVPDPLTGPMPAVVDTAKYLHTDLDSALLAETAYPTAVVEELPPPPPMWMSGRIGDARTEGVGDNSGVLAVVTTVVIALMVSYKSCRKLFVTLGRELWGMRQRENAFDEHTSNETRALGLLAVQWSVSIGILLYSWMQSRVYVDATHVFADVMSLICLAGGYYLAQLCAYSLVGYTFATPDGRKYFIQGFTSSQAFLGIALLVPSLVAIFYPAASLLMVQIAVILYILARIVFISKGFRIFYQNFGSLLYFILYLCTLEIIPLILIYNLALNLVSHSLV